MILNLLSSNTLNRFIFEKIILDIYLKNQKLIQMCEWIICLNNPLRLIDYPIRTTFFLLLHIEK